MEPKYEMPEYLLAVDPGKTTGFALLSCVAEPRILWAGDLASEDAWAKINEICAAYGP